ncbi:UNVERIFIED_CONTAM: hypothetical protein FKN15_023590 [Acipenser sinensis]
MSVQVNLKNVPSHLMESAYNNTDHQRSSRSSENMLTPISFPKTKIALWDPAPAGDVISLHLSYYRNPRLLVVEKTLRLAHRHARQSNRNDFSCFLLGSMVVDDDEEGVTLTVDRFDPGREMPGSPGKVPTALLPGDFLIPCTVSTQGPASGDTIVHSAEDFLIAFKMLQHRCCSKDTLDPSKLLTMRAQLTCAEHMDNLNFSLHWAAVTIANTLDATPVKPVPIIPTALARNLTSPMNIAQVQGVCKFGSRVNSPPNKLSVSDHDSGVEDEDFSPRPSPSPHPASQQLRRIHPSVPELSIVFDGSFTDSNKAAQCPQGFGIRPSPASAPQQHMRSTGPIQELHPEARQPSIGSCSGSFPVRRFLAPANQPMKVCKGRASPAPHQPVNWKGGPPLRKSSGSSASSASSSSSSSSSSTPQSGPSPNTSIHQPKGHLPSASKRGISPAGRPGAPGTQRPPSPGNPPARRGLPHSAQTPTRTSNFHMPSLPPHGPNQHPASFCSCCQHRGHVPCYPINSWQGVPNFASNSSPVYCPSDSLAHDCSFPPFHQGMSCQSNGHCSPICQTNSPASQASHGGTGSSAHDNSVLPMPGAQNTQKTSPSKEQFCLSHAACVPQPTTQPPAEIGLMVLPPDAFKILVEQDKQLKVLQAQIQKLLEAQSNPPCSHTSPPQSGRQVESVAMETQTAPGVQMKKSVSIAVSTGASLFWSPTVDQEEVAMLESQDEEMGISLTTEENTTHDSIASSLKAVDIHSFAESSQVIAEESILASNTASTLACIYPQAVLPKLNYVSFGNMASSGFGPSGVDLSLEANAIALKYLNDSQLSQLSVSRGGCQTGQEESQSLSIILQHNTNTTTEKSMVGMSLMSPNNMSFATRKYMKRYGLIECEDSSEEEEEGASESQIETTVVSVSDSYRKDYAERGAEKQQELLQQQTHRNSGARVCNDWEGNILKNITNEIPSQQQQQLSDQDSQQILGDLKPKMKLLAGVTHISQDPDKENSMQFFPDKLLHDSPVTQKHMESQGSVGNFLDVNRLRQIPKLF